MKRTARMVFAVAVTGVMLISCNFGKTKSEYYRHIHINMQQELVGRYPIDSTLANQINGYHFVYDSKGRPVMVEYSRRGQPARDPRFKVARIELNYWREFFVPKSLDWQRWTFWDEDNDPVANPDGVYDFYLKRWRGLDRDSEVGVIRKLNREPDRNGVYKYEYYFQSDGVVAVRYFDANNELMRDSSGVGEYEYRYDWQGNLVEARSNCADTNGVYTREFSYDTDGNLVETRYYDVDGKPVRMKEYGVPIVRRDYDENGYEIEISYHDENGNLTEGRDGIAVIRQDFSETGDLLSVKCYGRNGRLKALDESGVAEVHYEYNPQERKLIMRYLGVNGQPVEFSRNGAAVIRWLYNDDEKLKEMSFYGADGNLCTGPDREYAVIRKEYDECGYLSAIKYYDPDEKLIENAEGIAIYRCERDAHHRIVKSRYYNREERLTSLKSTGYAVITSNYDRWGNITEQRKFDPDGALTNGNSSFAISASKFNRHGQIIWQRYYDKDGNLTK